MLIENHVSILSEMLISSQKDAVNDKLEGSVQDKLWEHFSSPSL